MDKQFYENRIQAINQAVEESIANHRALLGRLEEAKFYLSEYEKEEKDQEEKSKEESTPQDQPTEPQPEPAGSEKTE